MKKNIIFLVSTLVCVALVIIGWFHFYDQRKETEYAPVAVPFIKKAISEISRWEPEVARSYMSPEFLKKISEANFDRILESLSRLGELQEMGEPQFAEIYNGDTLEGDRQTVLSYTLDARYASGPAFITISLLDWQGELKVYRFNVESEVLAL